jgi:hypothetical protein
MTSTARLLGHLCKSLILRMLQPNEALHLVFRTPGEDTRMNIAFLKLQNFSSSHPQQKPRLRSPTPLILDGRPMASVLALSVRSAWRPNRGICVISH